MMLDPREIRDRFTAFRHGGNRRCGLVSPGVLFAAMAAAGLAAAGLAAAPGAQAQSSQVQILCEARIQRVGDTLGIYGWVQTDQPTTVDYTMTVTTIAAANIGSTAQSGTISLDPNEPRRTSQVTVNILEGGYYEAELTAKERLTGNNCTSKTTSQG